VLYQIAVLLPSQKVHTNCQFSGLSWFTGGLSEVFTFQDIFGDASAIF